LLLQICVTAVAAHVYASFKGFLGVSSHPCLLPISSLPSFISALLYWQLIWLSQCSSHVSHHPLALSALGHGAYTYVLSSVVAIVTHSGIPAVVGNALGWQVLPVAPHIWQFQICDCPLWICPQLIQRCWHLPPF
jgi:hypothetical protein